MSSRIFRYIKKRRRSTVIHHIKDHMRQVADVVRAVNECLTAWSDDDAPRAQELALVVFQEENVADDLRREVAKKARSPGLSDQAREDLLRLSRRVDFIANFCKAASKNIYLLADLPVPTSIRLSARRMSNLLLKQVRLLEQTIETLGESVFPENVKTVDDLLLRINELEHEIDELYFDAKSEYLSRSEECSAAVLIILSDMLRNLENASDFTERTGELVMALLVTDT